MFETDPFILSHEERIQRMEASISEVAATMAAMSEQLKQVGEKVAEVGESLKNDIASLSRTNADDHELIKAEVVVLKTTQEGHGRSLDLLTHIQIKRLTKPLVISVLSKYRVSSSTVMWHKIVI